MSLLELLINQYPNLTIRKDKNMPVGISGLYYDNVILLNPLLSTYDQHGVIAEEIGHYETTYGDITDLSDVKKKKLEIVARRWGYEKVVSLERLIECYENGHHTIYEVCIFLEVTPNYLNNALDFYKMKYGTHQSCGEYEIYFDPLNVFRNNPTYKEEKNNGSL